jgi:MFS family permease
MRSFKLYFGAIGVNDKGDDYDVDTQTLPAMITFTFLIGCFFGSLLVSHIADSFGRKKSILVGGFGFLFGGAFQTFANSSVFYYSGRVISGLGIGVLSMCTPLYISETAAASIRGKMMTINQMMMTFGILFAAIINSIIVYLLIYY